MYKRLITKYNPLYTFLLIFSIVAGLNYKSLASNNYFPITSDAEQYNLSTITSFLVDTNNIYSIEQISNDNCPLFFKINGLNEIHSPHSFLTYWYKIELENKMQSSKSMILEFANSTIPKIRFYIKRNDKIYEYRTSGSSLPYNTRDIDNPNFCYRLDFGANEKVTIIAQIEPQGDGLNIPILLYDTMYFSNKTSNNALINGIYYGLMLLIIIISVIMIISFSNFSDKTIYIFFGILFSFTLWNAVIDGLSFEYLWPLNPWISKISIYALPLCGIVFMSLFTNEIKENKFTSILFYCIKLFITLYILLFIFYSFYFNLSPIYIHSISLFLGTGILIITFISWYLQIKNQPESAIYYIGLFATILAWLFIITLKTFTNLFPSSFYIFTFKLFLGLQALILTLCVISKLRLKYAENYYNTLIKLDQEVKTKTTEINDKNKEIESINKDISMINSILQKQNKELKLKSDLLVNDFNFAKNIQQALLLNSSLNSKLGKQVFTLLKPKDSLTSDIFFIKQIDNLLFIAVIDCSSQGVTGSLLSTLSYNYLHTIIDEKGIYETDKIVQSFQTEINHLYKSNADFFGIYSIDIGVISINIQSNILNYSGTKIPLWIVSDEGTTKIKGETNAICDNKTTKEYHFNVESIELKQGNMVYMFTNGYTNQLNASSVKLMKKNLQILLSEIQGHPINIQKNELEKKFMDWKGSEEQTDDMLIIGIKI